MNKVVPNRKFPLLYILLFFSLIQWSFRDTSVDQILKKLEDKYTAGSVVGELRISVEGQKWMKNMHLQTWSLGNDYAMVKMLDEKNEGMVFLKTENAVWNYVPKLKKVMKMPPNMMSGGFMGSDMSTDNLLNITSFKEDYDIKLMGAEIINGRNCHHLQMLPKKDAKVLWGKIEMFVDVKEYIQMKMIFYDDKLKPANEMVGDKIKSLGGKMLASHYTVKSFNGKKQVTYIQYEKLDFSQNLKASFFTKENMKNI